MNRSTNKALPSSKKTHSERHKQILKQLLKEEGNRTCVDCKTTAHPRWASWNLGCFICIRCSGVHRSMGVHISKVKSVDLDAWTDEQVESMLKWGNEKCNLYWEAKLPLGYIPDQLKIENFIRTKYDLKKWVESPTIPDPLKIVSTKPSNIALLDQVTENNGSSTTIKSTPDIKMSENLLDDDFGHFSSVSNLAINSTKASLVPSNLPTQPKSLPKLPNHSGFSSPHSTSDNLPNDRPDLKKSILSLYSSASSSTSSFVQPAQRPPPQSKQSLSPAISSRAFSSPSPVPSSQINTLNNSLQGLNFTNNLNSTFLDPESTLSKASTKEPNLSWNNEWSDTKQRWTPASNPSQVDSNDDLFKNVWN